MPTARITQNVVEVLVSSYSKARVTQTVVEVLFGDYSKARLTQTVIEVLSAFATTTTTTTTVTTTTVTTTTVPGSVVYGHDTAVEEDFVEDFAGKWEGTATISGSDDAENLEFYVGQEKKLIAPHWYGTDEAVIKLNKYQAGDNVSIYYKTAGSLGAIAAEPWADYVGKFTSQGFVDVLLGRDYEPPIMTTTTTTTTTTGTTITVPGDIADEAMLLLL
jgi:hypothetical protein